MNTWCKYEVWRLRNGVYCRLITHKTQTWSLSDQVGPKGLTCLLECTLERLSVELIEVTIRFPGVVLLNAFVASAVW